MATQPTTLPEWATDADRTVEPSAGEKGTGWQAGYAPPARKMNWLFNVIYQWWVWLTAHMSNGVTDNDLTLWGSDVTGTDQDGGDITLSAGESTGNGGSEIRFRAAQAGQGAGAAQRSTVEVGRFTENGRLLVALAPLQVAPQGDPASPEDGDLYVESVTNKLRSYNGQEIERHVPQVHAITADATQSAYTTQVAISTYAIRSGSLVAGSTVRVRAQALVSTAGASHNLTVGMFDGASLVGCQSVSGGSAGSYYFEGTFTIRNTGASGQVRAGGVWSEPGSIYNTGASGTLDTTGIIYLSLYGQAAASSTTTAWQFVVDVT